MKKYNSEFEYLENTKAITIALLATAVAIMSNLLQVKDVDNCQNLQTAVTIFSITIPYYIWDVYFLNLELPDGKYEKKIFVFLRIIFWLTGATGIGYTFNYLKNKTEFTTLNLFVICFVVFFIIRFYPIVAYFYKQRRENK